MHTPSPAAGNTPPSRGRPRQRAFTWPPIVLYLAPVVAIAVYGALWIALHAGGGRASTHTIWQSLALAETVLALLLRGRKPTSALAGIMAVYLLFSLDLLLLPAVLFALLTVAATRDRRTTALAATATAAVLAAMPYLHGDAVSFAWYILPRLAVAGILVAAGMCLRERREGAGGRTHARHPASEGEPRRQHLRPGASGGPGC